MKQDKTGSIIVTNEDERLVHPEGLPADNIGEPECTDWKEKAFELARELEETQKQLTRAKDYADNREVLARMLSRTLDELGREHDQLKEKYEELCRQKASDRFAQRALADLWYRIERLWKSVKTAVERLLARFSR